MQAWLRQHWLWVLVALVLGGGLGYALYQKAQPEAIPAVQLQREDVTATLTLTGEVTAHVSIAVSPSTAGRIQRMAVDEGDTVSPGQVLAVLDQQEALAALAQAQGNLVQARAALQRVKEGTRPEELARLQAQIQQSATGIRQNEAALASAQATLADANRRVERYARLVGQGAVSRQEYEQAQTNQETAQQEIARLQALIASARAGVTQSRQQYLQAQRGPTAATVEEVQGAYEAAQAAVKAAEVQRRQTVIRSHSHGVVTERLQQAGEYATPGQALLRIANRDTLEIRADVEEADLSRVQVGARAIITLDAAPDVPLPAQVTRIGDAVNPENGTVSVTLMATPGKGFPVALLPGMTADVNIITAQLKQALVLPITAVEPKDGQKIVYRFEDGRFTPRVVQVEPLSLDTVRVRAGLQAGDWVARQADDTLPTRHPTRPVAQSP